MRERRPVEPSGTQGSRAKGMGVAMSQEMKPAPVKPAITLADLDRLDIRVGTPVPDGTRAG